MSGSWTCRTLLDNTGQEVHIVCSAEEGSTSQSTWYHIWYADPSSNFPSDSDWTLQQWFVCVHLIFIWPVLLIYDSLPIQLTKWEEHLGDQCEMLHNYITLNDDIIIIEQYEVNGYQKWAINISRNAIDSVLVPITPTQWLLNKRTISMSDLNIAIVAATLCDRI